MITYGFSWIYNAKTIQLRHKIKHFSFYYYTRLTYAHPPGTCRMDKFLNPDIERGCFFSVNDMYGFSVFPNSMPSPLNWF